jgi:prepilin-type N-terminal cleavage/methylation domain-containing protein
MFVEKKQKNKRGFTLIEIMVVVLIIVALSAITILTIDIARKKTKDAIIISQLEQIQAIAETIYNPETGYKELYDMRKDPASVEDDYETLKEIGIKIDEMGKSFNLWFPHDSASTRNDYSSYCAYVYLFMNPNNVFCVDSRGVAEEIDVSDDKDIHCMVRETGYDNCDYR